MTEIIALTDCLGPYVSRSLLGQLRQIVGAMLCISGRVTMLGLSRWTERGGSYRTLQRFYQSRINWALLHWTLIKTHLLRPDGVYLLAGDEVVVSKAGKRTHGLGRFYSSLAGRPIPGLSFLALSLVDVQQRRSYPLQLEQRLPVKPAEKAAPAPKRGRGRPKGSKSHVKAAPSLSPELSLLGDMVRATLTRMAPLAVQHVVLDGFFGTYPATWLVRDCGLHLISKLRHDAALYRPYAGEKPRRGPTPRYGDKLNYAQLPDELRVSSERDGDDRLDTYHLQAYHKEQADLLNSVVIVKTHLKTGKRGHVVLFSTDLRLSAAQIVEYYSLRFQIEFNFRDSKQHWGLEDFMNVAPTAVTNAANLAFLMVNLSTALLQPHRRQQPDFSVLDLKVQFRAQRYLHETIKCLPDPPDDDLISRIWCRLTLLGGIRPRHPNSFAA